MKSRESCKSYERPPLCHKPIQREYVIKSKANTIELKEALHIAAERALRAIANSSQDNLVLNIKLDSNEISKDATINLLIIVAEETKEIILVGTQTDACGNKNETSWISKQSSTYRKENNVKDFKAKNINHVAPTSRKKSNDKKYNNVVTLSSNSNRSSRKEPILNEEKVREDEGKYGSCIPNVSQKGSMYSEEYNVLNYEAVSTDCSLRESQMEFNSVKSRSVAISLKEPMLTKGTNGINNFNLMLNKIPLFVDNDYNREMKLQPTYVQKREADCSFTDSKVADTVTTSKKQKLLSTDKFVGREDKINTSMQVMRDISKCNGMTEHMTRKRTVNHILRSYKLLNYTSKVVELRNIKSKSNIGNPKAANILVDSDLSLNSFTSLNINKNKSKMYNEKTSKYNDINGSKIQKDVRPAHKEVNVIRSSEIEDQSSFISKSRLKPSKGLASDHHEPNVAVAKENIGDNIIVQVEPNICSGVANLLLERVFEKRLKSNIVDQSIQRVERYICCIKKDIVRNREIEEESSVGIGKLGKRRSRTGYSTHSDTSIFKANGIDEDTRMGPETLGMLDERESGLTIEKNESVSKKTENWESCYSTLENRVSNLQQPIINLMCCGPNTLSVLPVMKKDLSQPSSCEVKCENSMEKSEINLAHQEKNNTTYCKSQIITIMPAINKEHHKLNSLRSVNKIITNNSKEPISGMETESIIFCTLPIAEQAKVYSQENDQVILSVGEHDNHLLEPYVNPAFKVSDTGSQVESDMGLVASNTTAGSIENLPRNLKNIKTADVDTQTENIRTAMVDVNLMFNYDPSKCVFRSCNEIPTQTLKMQQRNILRIIHKNCSLMDDMPSQLSIYDNLQMAGTQTNCKPASLPNHPNICEVLRSQNGNQETLPELLIGNTDTSCERSTQTKQPQLANEEQVVHSTELTLSSNKSIDSRKSLQQNNANISLKDSIVIYKDKNQFVKPLKVLNQINYLGFQIFVTGNDADLDNTSSRPITNDKNIGTDTTLLANIAGVILERDEFKERNSVGVMATPRKSVKIIDDKEQHTQTFPYKLQKTISSILKPKSVYDYKSNSSSFEITKETTESYSKFLKKIKQSISNESLDLNYNKIGVKMQLEIYKLLEQCIENIVKKQIEKISNSQSSNVPDDTNLLLKCCEKDESAQTHGNNTRNTSKQNLNENKSYAFKNNDEILSDDKLNTKINDAIINQKASSCAMSEEDKFVGVLEKNVLLQNTSLSESELEQNLNNQMKFLTMPDEISKTSLCVSTNFSTKYKDVYKVINIKQKETSREKDDSVQNEIATVAEIISEKLHSQKALNEIKQSHSYKMKPVKNIYCRRISCNKSRNKMEVVYINGKKLNQTKSKVITLKSNLENKSLQNINSQKEGACMKLEAKFEETLGLSKGLQPNVEESIRGFNMSNINSTNSTLVASSTTNLFDKDYTDINQTMQTESEISFSENKSTCDSDKQFVSTMLIPVQKTALTLEKHRKNENNSIETCKQRMTTMEMEKIMRETTKFWSGLNHDSLIEAKPCTKISTRKVNIAESFKNLQSLNLPLVDQTIARSSKTSVNSSVLMEKSFAIADLKEKGQTDIEIFKGSEREDDIKRVQEFQEDKKAVKYFKGLKDLICNSESFDNNKLSNVTEINRKPTNHNILLAKHSSGELFSAVTKSSVETLKKNLYEGNAKSQSGANHVNNFYECCIRKDNLNGELSDNEIYSSTDIEETDIDSFTDEIKPENSCKTSVESMEQRIYSADTSEVPRTALNTELDEDYEEFVHVKRNLKSLTDDELKKDTEFLLSQFQTEINKFKLNVSTASQQPVTCPKVLKKMEYSMKTAILGAQTVRVAIDEFQDAVSSVCNKYSANHMVSSTTAVSECSSDALDVANFSANSASLVSCSSSNAATNRSIQESKEAIQEKLSKHKTQLCEKHSHTKSDIYNVRSEDLENMDTQNDINQDSNTSSKQTENNKNDQNIYFVSTSPVQFPPEIYYDKELDKIEDTARKLIETSSINLMKKQFSLNKTDLLEKKVFNDVFKENLPSLRSGTAAKKSMDSLDINQTINTSSDITSSLENNTSQLQREIKKCQSLLNYLCNYNNENRLAEDLRESFGSLSLHVNNLLQITKKISFKSNNRNFFQLIDEIINILAAFTRSIKKAAKYLYRAKINASIIDVEINYHISFVAINLVWNIMQTITSQIENLLTMSCIVKVTNDRLEPFGETQGETLLESIFYQKQLLRSTLSDSVKYPPVQQENTFHDQIIEDTCRLQRQCSCSSISQEQEQEQEQEPLVYDYTTIDNLSINSVVHDAAFEAICKDSPVNKSDNEEKKEVTES